MRIVILINRITKLQDFWSLWVTLLVVAGLFASNIHAAEKENRVENQASEKLILILDDRDKQKAIGRFLSIYEDRDGKMTFEQVKQLNPGSWFRTDRDVPSFGFTESAFWLRFVIANQTQNSRAFLLSIENSALDRIHVYYEQNGQSRVDFLVGDNFPFSAREIYHRNFILPLELAANNSAKVTLRITNLGAVQFPIFIRDERAQAANEQTELLGWGLFFGILLVMSLYNFILFFATAEKTYFLFALYILSMTVFQLGLYGLGFQYVWPNYETFNSWIIATSVGLLYASGSAFIQSFINIKQFSKVQHYSVNFIMYLALFGSFIAPFIPYQYSMPALTMIALPFSSLGVIVSATALYNGLTAARFFLWSWIIFTSFLLILAINKLGIIPRNLLTENGIQFGSILSVLFMSLALADRINIDRKQRIESNNEAMRLEKRANREHELLLQSEINRKEEELQAQKQIITAREEVLLAKAQSKTKSGFLATMSHEIRTPLHGIIGMSDMLFDTKLDKRQTQYLEVIKNSGSSLLNIINDILDFSKIEAGHMEIESRVFELKKICKETTDNLYLIAKEKQISLQCQFTESSPWLIKKDSNRLQQILINLIGNAIKFSEKGEITLRVSLLSSIDASGDNSLTMPVKNRLPLVKFEVIDHGIGVSKEQQQKLFKTFSQADGSTTRKYGGTGLGLSICKRLVELMGGTIGVESTKGQGAAFWFTIQSDKLDQSDLSETVGLAKSSETLAVPTMSQDRLNGLRVLIAEDNKINQIVIKGLASKLGLITTVVENGQQALDYVKQNHQKIDLVLMDCEMPVLDGYNASKKIRQWEEQQNLDSLVIFAVTAHALDEHKKVSKEALMDEHISKPVSLKILYQTIVENKRIVERLNNKTSSR